MLLLEHPRTAALDDEHDRIRMMEWAERNALQQPNSWDGFTVVPDQFLLMALRYQLVALEMALGTTHHTHTPNYLGEREEALRALIYRMTDRIVWQYWVLENRLGMLRGNPDPIDSTANIMFSGYLLLMLSMYRQATGDDRFDQPGALRFRWDETTEFRYSHSEIAEKVAENFRRSRLGLWACEPGWVFPYCNTVALLGLRMYDTIFGTDLADAVTDRFLHGLHTEFTAGDGDIVTVQAERFGFTMRPARGITNTAAHATLLGPIDPDFAWRTWHLFLDEEVQTGNYLRTEQAGSPAPTDADWGGEKNRANGLAAGLWLARDRDATVHAQLREALRALENPQTTYRPFAAGVHANGILGWSLGGGDTAWSRAVLDARPTTTGPRLVRATHPSPTSISVATAISDGRDHTTVLYPAGEHGRRRLRYDRLMPHRTYRVRGGLTRHVTADGTGHASIEADLTARHVLHLRPTN